MAFDWGSKGANFRRELMAEVEDVIRRLVEGVSATVQAQKDGTRVSDLHRILNFQGAGVTVSDDPATRRVNINIPGAPTTSTTSTFVSTAGSEKVYTLASGDIAGAPANWQTTGFSDAAWSASVLMTVNISAFYTPVSSTSWVSDVAGVVTVPAGCLVRRTMALPAGTIVSATLEINIDDDAGPEKGIYINGTSVGSGFVRGTTSPIGPAVIPISTSLLTPGANNVLAVHVRDSNTGGSSPHSVSYRLTVGYTAAGTDTQYELVVHKSAASGYASLDSGTKVPTAQLGTGTPSSSNFLRGDRTWAPASTNSIVIQEVDGTPSVAATTLKMPNSTLTDNLDGSVTYAPPAAGAVPYILIEDHKTQNTAGGTFTSGADRTRDLNTIVVDTSSLASLASNQFTLPAGSYRFRIAAPAMQVLRHQAFLYNVTDAVEVKRGSSGFSQGTSNGGNNYSWIVGRMTIAASKTFEVRHRCQTTVTNYGFGTEANFGTEIYTMVELFKES